MSKKAKTKTKTVYDSRISRIPEMLARLMVRPAGISEYVSVRGIDRPVHHIDKSLKICVMQQTTYSWPFARGYWLEKDPKNRFFDIYTIKSVSHRCTPTAAHETRIHLGSSSQWFGGRWYGSYGNLSTPVIELPLNWNEKLYYFSKDRNTDADGNPININCFDLSKFGPKSTYGMLISPPTDGTLVPKSLFTPKKFVNYRGQYYHASSAETNAIPLRDVVCGPYVAIGYRVYANQKIYAIYGCILTDENGTPDRTIYMAQCNKKVRCEVAKPIPAPDEWNKDVLKYVTPEKITAETFHGVDVKCNFSEYEKKNGKKFDLYLWAVTSKKYQQTLLSDESVKIIEDVIGKDNAVYVTDTRPSDCTYLGKTKFVYANQLCSGYFSCATLVDMLNRAFSRQFVRIETNPDTGEPCGNNLVYMRKKEYNLFVESTNIDNTDTNTESGSIVNKTIKRVKSKKYLDKLHDKNTSEMLSNGLLYLSVSEIDKITDFFNHDSTLKVSHDIVNSRESNFGITARIKYNGQWYNVIKYLDILSRSLNYYNYYSCIQSSEFERNFRNLCKLRLQEKLDNNTIRISTPATDVDTNTIFGNDKHNIVKMTLGRVESHSTSHNVSTPEKYAEYTAIGLYSIYVYPDNPGSKACTGFYITRRKEDCTKVSVGGEIGSLNSVTELDVQLVETDVYYEKSSIHSDARFCTKLIDFADIFSSDKFSSVFPKCMSMHFNDGLPNIYSTKPLMTSSWSDKYSINYILNDELDTPPKYLRTAYEHAETHGVPKLLVRYADRLNDWCKRPKGKSDTVKNIYYRSLSDILYELPHSKILILGELSTPLIESGGCMAAMTLVKILETLLVTPTYRTTSLGINAITDDAFRKILSSVIKSISCINESRLLVFERSATEWFKTLSTDLILMSTAFAENRHTSVALNLYTVILNKITENLLPSVLLEVRSPAIGNASTVTPTVGDTISIISDTIMGIRDNVGYNRISANWHLEELSRVTTIGGITEVHNSVVNANNAARGKQHEANMAKIQTMYEGRVDALRRKFEYADNDCGYAIVVPKKLSEIVTEGLALSHCVGSYTEKVANGITNIMFLRNTKDLGIPFMTIEVYHGEIRQIHGRGNNNIKDQKDCAGITKFLGAWCKEKNIRGLQDRYSLACAPQV